MAVSVITKGYIHAHIAYRNDIPLGGSGGLPARTFWYFTKPVSSEYESLKKKCNYLQTGNLILLFIVILISSITT